MENEDGEVMAVHVDGRVCIEVVTEEGEAEIWLEVAEVERFLEELNFELEGARAYRG